MPQYGLIPFCKVIYCDNKKYHGISIQKRRIKVKKYLWGICLPLIGLLMCACASKPLPLPDWNFEKAAINIDLKADNRLNLNEEIPHTLLLCLYQLKDRNTFNRIAENQEGIYKLLECNLFDSSVTSVKRLIVNPGQDMNFTLDRAEGTRYVAVVAGYYLLAKERMIRFYEVPVEVRKKGMIMKEKYQVPTVMNIILNLGPKQILN